MRAIAYERVGPADEVLRLIELPTPEPGPGEVRVRLRCSGVNPSDVKTRGGVRSKELPFPRIVPHSDGAGVIDAVGEGVSPDCVDERVWVWNAAWQRPYGTAAEYVVLPRAQAVPLPGGVDDAVGACLGIPALTAYHAVNCNGGVGGKTVLIAGGAGSVGQYAIQMARYAGASRIITTVSSGEKAAVASSLGADAVVNYRTEPVAQRVLELTDGAGVDRIVEVEFSGNAALDAEVIASGGEIVAYGSDAGQVSIPFFPSIVRNVAIQFFIVYNLTEQDRRRAIAGVTRLLQAGALQHAVAARLPLDRCAEAHSLIERGAVTGNVVLSIGTDDVWQTG
ncbi:MAG: NADPH:quinone reductase [Ectothiorhodospiraceae bacterium]|nr:NADPH:quinone reductase [Ectothiorhodospiraceae bacterium]